MKAHKIYETIGFKRGGDPHKSLNIGGYRPFEEGDIIELKEDIFVYWLYGYKNNQDANRFIRDDERDQYDKEKINLSLHTGTKLRYNGKMFGELVKSKWESAGWNIADFLYKNPDIYTRLTNESLNESIVTNKQGKPLIVYHGTPDSRFAEIRNEYKGQYSNKLTGGNTNTVWFSDNYRTAKSYADPTRAFDYQGAEPQVLSKHIILDNPLIIDANGKEWRKIKIELNGKTLIGTHNITIYAQENGYDGIIIKNVYDHYSHFKGESKIKANMATNYAVFSDDQIIDI